MHPCQYAFSEIEILFHLSELASANPNLTKVNLKNKLCNIKIALQKSFAQ